ncbi:MAG: VWA domain-containing protein, partial [Verrucomicrobiota bacterium]|nr:VWA domain-containing protein [Verrucomicrobiota bacterium]
MRVAFLFILSVFLAFASVQAGDYIIVVDASQSMREQIKVKIDRLPVLRTKRQLVKDQLVEYLEQIPPDGSRVYIVYFHSGIAKHKEKEAATEFIFDVKGKEAAIAQANDLDDILPGRSKFFGSKGGTHLWSSFHKALKFAEDKKYYRAKDDKAKTPEIVPHILLLSDGKDDQGGDGEWAYDAKKPPKNKDQIILKAHPWLPMQKAAVWYQLGTEIKVAWKGTVVVAGVGKNVDKPLNQPNATLSGPNGGTLERHQLEGGGSIAKAKINDEIKVKP